MNPEVSSQHCCKVNQATGFMFSLPFCFLVAEQRDIRDLHTEWKNVHGGGFDMKSEQTFSVSEMDGLGQYGRLSKSSVLPRFG